MDDRQTQIRSGAGLEESRLNQDFIDFLKKWSTPVLWLIVLIGAAWWGLRYLKEQRIAKVDNAFASLNEASSGGNPSPASLRTIAADYAGVRSVSELALLQTVDIYLRAAIAGVEPGAEIDPATGQPVNEGDVLDADRVRGYLSQARDMSRGVADSTAGQAGKELLNLQAWMRLGASQEGLGSVEDAKSSYERAAAVAREGGFPELVLLAEARRDAAGDGVAVEALPSEQSLAPLPGEQRVETPAAFPEIIDGDTDGDIGGVEDSATPDGAPAQDEPLSDQPASP
jgi:hypothetical protein